MAAEAGAVHVRLAADAEVEQLQEQSDDQRLTGYEQDLFHHNGPEVRCAANVDTMNGCSC